MKCTDAKVRSILEWCKTSAKGRQRYTVIEFTETEEFAIRSNIPGWRAEELANLATCSGELPSC
jgi:hypothetical protein